MKFFRKVVLVCLVFATIITTSSCGGSKEISKVDEKAKTQNDVNVNTNTNTENPTEKKVKNFEIQLPEGWKQDDNQSRADMKSYTFFKDYMSTAFIMMYSVSPKIFEGTAESISNYYAGSDGKAPFNIISVDKISIIDYPAVRCITEVTANNKNKQIQYYIDAEGPTDIYITVNSPVDKVSEVQAFWDEALKTLKLEY